MKIDRVKLLYIISILFLVALFATCFNGPMAGGKSYSMVQREQLVKTRNGWIIQFDLVNQQKQDAHYTIRTVVDQNQPYQEQVLVGSGGIFTFTQQIPAQMVKTGEAKITISSAQSTVPFEETYHLY